MFREEKTRSVGRPKLADTKLKKTSIIMCIICLVVIITLLIVGAYKLNIIKLRGDSSDRFEVGDKFCLDTECFYTISDDGTTVTALAKYNLLVGYTMKYENGYNDNSPLYEITTDTEGYGLQSYRALGYNALNNDLERVGLVPFTEKVNGQENIYWWNNNAPATGYENKYPYVYDNNASSHVYLDNYKNSLAKMGYDVKKVKLLSKEQAVSLGCDDSDAIHENRCLEAPAWVTTSSYWLGSAKEGSIYLIESNSYILPVNSPSVIFGFGIRPVIEIDKSEIPKDRGLKQNYNIGDEVCIKSECFNVINKDKKKNEVTLFAKYNLLVGYNVTYNINDGTATIEELDTSISNYGLQDKNVVISIANGSSNAIGVSPFIKLSEEQIDVIRAGETLDIDYYWMDGENVKTNYIKEIYIDDESIPYLSPYDNNSYLYKYVEQYKQTVSNLGDITIKSARVPDGNDYVASIYYYDLWENWSKPGYYWTSVAFRPEMIVVGSEKFDETGVEEPKMPPYSFLPIRPVLVVNIDELNKTPQETTTKKQDIKIVPATDTDKINRKVIYDIENIKKTTTKVTTTKKSNIETFGNKVITNTNKEFNWWLVIICIIDGALLMIVILLASSLLGKKKRH